MATPEELEAAGRAWDTATRGITGAEGEVAVFRDEFAEAITSGKSLHDLEDALQDSLSELDWTWPWFERWYETFAGWGIFPFNWPPLEPRPMPDPPPGADELAAYRKAAIAPLIAHTAAMIFFRDRHVARARPDVRWKLATRNDEAERRVAAQMSPAIEAGDLGKLPPFFPGDRTALQTDSPLRATVAFKT